MKAVIQLTKNLEDWQMLLIAVTFVNQIILNIIYTDVIVRNYEILKG